MCVLVEGCESVRVYWYRESGGCIGVRVYWCEGGRGEGVRVGVRVHWYDVGRGCEGRGCIV